jgi:multiple sugar transport system ATP-binding protein
MTQVRLEEVRVAYDGREVVRGVSFTVESGELAVLVGRSGSGKTSLLRAITGYATLSGGRVFLGGKDVTDQPPAQRDIAMVFQSYALYPHMTVDENWRFPLQAVKLPKAEQDARIARVAETLQMRRLLHRFPRELSGGQQQRVAMGRALVRQPQLFLLDEPLGALDAKLRVEARSAFKTVQRELGATTLYVTHDQTEAQALGSRIVVLDDGVVQQVGTPDQIYDDPANTFVAGLFGSPPMNALPGTLRREADALIAVSGPLVVPLPVAMAARIEADQASDGIILGVRPEAITRVAARGPGVAEGTVYVTEPIGHNVLVDVRLGESLVRMRGDRDDDGLVHLAPDDPILLRVDPERILVFDRITGRRLG